MKSNIPVPVSTRDQVSGTGASDKPNFRPGRGGRVVAVPQCDIFPTSRGAVQQYPKPAVKKKGHETITASASKTTYSPKRKHDQVDRDDDASSDEEGELFVCPFSRPRPGFNRCTVLGEGRKWKKAVRTFFTRV